jgi:hypothetical protein
VCSLLAAAGLAVVTLREVRDEGQLPEFVAAPSVRAAGEPGAANGAQVARRLSVTPKTVRIPELKLTGTIDAVGVGPDGQLAVPVDPARIGWWIGGAGLGSATGTVLLAGHVDTVDNGPGALYRLEKLRMGATITVDSADERYTYRVTARRVYRKSALPKNLFDATGRPTLALVTCGGAFDRDTGYDKNVVVYAEPVGGPAPRR